MRAVLRRQSNCVGAAATTERRSSVRARGDAPQRREKTRRSGRGASPSRKSRRAAGAFPILRARPVPSLAVPAPLGRWPFPPLPEEEIASDLSRDRKRSVHAAHGSAVADRFRMRDPRVGDRQFCLSPQDASLCAVRRHRAARSAGRCRRGCGPCWHRSWCRPRDDWRAAS